MNRKPSLQKKFRVFAKHNIVSSFEDADSQRFSARSRVTAGALNRPSMDCI